MLSPMVDVLPGMPSERSSVSGAGARRQGPGTRSRGAECWSADGRSLYVPKSRGRLMSFAGTSRVDARKPWRSGTRRYSGWLDSAVIAPNVDVYGYTRSRESLSGAGPELMKEVAPVENPDSSRAASRRAYRWMG